MKQEVIAGTNGLERAATIIRNRGWHSVLIVTGERWMEDACKQLSGLGIQPSFFLPPTGLLRIEAVKDFVEKGLPAIPEVVVAIGGGRIIDAAKILLHLLSPHRPYFIVLPTTAGSGSEATSFAVVYEGLEKRSIGNKMLLADLVLLDQQLLRGLPAGQRAVSGMDAFTQAVESTWNLHATNESLTYARTALSLLWKALPPFVHTIDEERDRQVQWAAYLSGKSIAITKTTGCHALSYYLTARHGIPHGQAAGIFLPLFFLYNAGTAPMEELYRMLNVQDAAEAAEVLEKWMRQCGIATRFSQLRINVDVDALVLSVNKERFDNNPAPFNAEKLKRLIIEKLL